MQSQETIFKEFTMIKNIYLLASLLSVSLLAQEIPTKHAKERILNKSVSLNSQVVQLSNASQVVTSLVSGHLEKYFVSPGETVKTGQKIALIESIRVSKMTANYVSLKKQYQAQMKNYNSVKKLYESGMTSMSELNNQSMKKDALLWQINALKSQLMTLNIDADKLKVATPNFTLYAHSGGVVSQLHQPLHTVIKEDEALISIVKDQAFFIKSFLPLEYASSLRVGQKLVVQNGKQNITTHVTQVLPSVDEKTQRIIILSSVDEKSDNLFINAYIGSKLYFGEDKKYVTVEKSALSFFNNEWVVFVSKHEEEHKEEKDMHEEHSEEHEEDHNGDGHDEHEEVEVPYEARVVQIIEQNEDFVALLGLELGEEYVSDKSYYVKSMMLKSSLGEHGH